MRYSELKSYLQGRLAGGPYANIDIYPGPYLPQVPNRHVILTPTVSPGINTEGMLDEEGWQVRVVGEQHDYDDAELLAMAVDAPLRQENSQQVGGIWVVSMNRSGGKPYPLLTDDAERTHFVCSYYLDVELV